MVHYRYFPSVSYHQRGVCEEKKEFESYLEESGFSRLASKEIACFFYNINDCFDAFMNQKDKRDRDYLVVFVNQVDFLRDSFLKSLVSLKKTIEKESEIFDRNKRIFDECEDYTERLLEEARKDMLADFSNSFVPDEKSVEFRVTRFWSASVLRNKFIELEKRLAMLGCGYVRQWSVN